MVHALMQDSESFLCGGEEHSLALVLAKAGFDVWLGESGGRKEKAMGMRLTGREGRGG
jgi:hypothetical protein